MLSRWGGLAMAVAAAVVVVVTVLVLGINTPVRRAGSAGVALGPDSGEQVDAYLAHAAAARPTAGGPYWALVSLRAELTPAAAAAVPGSARLSRVVLQVPLQRVQTAQLRVDLADQGDRAAVLQHAMTAASDELQRSQAADERAAVVAQVSVPRLRSGCACVLAMLVRASADQLRAIAAAPAVRAVQAAPAGTELRALSVMPLLPEQTAVVAPLPDDGPIPAP